ncbi:hybrid sensor histidine kinase/response regulator [Candidatus Magnetomonas plexicatena]|uniref:hybrid sensor histidine kinase/response regulator n=1 Tax=Candidatus Magnetomonas plexicatena TaxID=2552947 RepID=UPI001C78F97A|nr:hybrid sensor histidine kinase/response regulator [Nitrospirales bacterium LBB_01]
MPYQVRHDKLRAIMIEDAELRDIFKAETEEHLQKLEDGLVQFEQAPDTPGLLEELFRESHSLKGSARLMGVDKIELVSHTLEDMLVKAKRGTTKLSTVSVNSIYKCLDVIKALLHEALTGETANINIIHVIEELKGERASSPPPVKPNPEPPKAQTQTPSPAKPESAVIEPVIPKKEPEKVSLQAEETPPLSMPQPETQPDDDTEETATGTTDASLSDGAVLWLEGSGKRSIETIRVEAGKLDSLMVHVGELVVIKNRINQRINDIQETVSMWESVVLPELSGSSDLSVQQLAHLANNREVFYKHLNNLKNSLSEDGARISFVSQQLDHGAHELMLIPLSTVFNPFKRMVRDLANEKAKEINFYVEGGDTTAEKRVLEEIKDPLMHILRNAIDHAIETPDVRKGLGKKQCGLIVLKAYKESTNIIIEVLDDGQGLATEKIKETAIKNKLVGRDVMEKMTTAEIHNFIFTPGFSTNKIVTDISGRGIGMDVVKTALERLKGSITLESVPNEGCKMTLRIPVNISSTRVFLVIARNRTYALPIEFVMTTFMLNLSDVYNVEGQKTFTFMDKPVSVLYITDILEITERADSGRTLKADSLAQKLPCIMFKIEGQVFGVLVDVLVDEQEIVVKSYGGILKRVRNVLGSTILGSGEVCMVLNPHDILKTIKSGGYSSTSLQQAEALSQQHSILMAEDSITTRTQMKRILEGAGYEVTACVDGLDALNKLKTADFDAVVSDVQMPNMDGLTLTENIRMDTKYRELPVILVTTMSSDEDMKRGIEVGANAYITKPAFDKQVFLETLKRLII